MKWLPLHGILTIADDSLSFVGENRGKARNRQTVDLALGDEVFAIARSDKYFQAGTISCKVKIEKPNSKVIFRLASDNQRILYVGLNFAEHPYGILIGDGQEVRPIAVSGTGSPPPTGVEFELQIKVAGSTIELFINGIRAVTGQANVSRHQLEIALQGQGRITVQDIRLTTETPKVFVVMQFSNEFTAMYEDVIKKVCLEFGYEVIRGDDVYTTSMIIEDINRQIQTASLIVADITPNNPNVYYEVGYAHALGKPTILLSDRSRDKLPFDVSGFRVLFYDNTIGGKSKVEEALRKHLVALNAA